MGNCIECGQPAIAKTSQGRICPDCWAEGYGEETAPMTDTQTPERIWVGEFDDPNDGYVLGSWGIASLNDGRTQYVRADLHDAVVAERDQLKVDLAKLTRPKSGNQPDIAYWKFRFAEAAEERDQLKAEMQEIMRHCPDKEK